MDKGAKHETPAKPDLLEMWTGESDVEPDGPRSSPLRQFMLVLLTVAAVVLCVVLAKYAVDVLTILLMMTLAVLVLRAVESILVESSFFTFGMFGVLLLGAAVLAYAFMGPRAGFSTLARYVPAPVVAFLNWSETHGWGHTALIDFGPGETSPEPASAPEPEAASPTPRAAASPAASPALTLTASNSSSARGEPVYLTARLAGAADASSPAASIRFRDGLVVLGSADVRQEGQARVAVLTVRGLSEGRHEFTAELVGTFGFASATSTPLVHVVTAAAR